MPSSTPRQQRFFNAVLRAKDNPNYGDTTLRKVADSMPRANIEDFAKSIAELKVKKAMLSILKDIRDPMYLEEDEKDASIDPIADKQEVEGNVDWATYIKPYVGQPLSPKELEAVNTFKSETGKTPTNPTTGRVIELWYRGTNDMNQSQTTVIKKLKDGNQFSYNAFTKYDKPKTDKPEEPPMPPPDVEPEMGADMGAGGVPEGPGEPTPPGTEEPKPQEEEKDYEIVLTKSILFNDDIKGGAILAQFLKKLEL